MMAEFSRYQSALPEEQGAEIGHDNLAGCLRGTLIEVVHSRSGKQCFASDAYYACSDVQCRWRENCKQLNEIWLL